LQKFKIRYCFYKSESVPYFIIPIPLTFNTQSITQQCAPQANSNGDTHQYPDAYKQNFIAGCVQSSGEAYRTYCECVFNKVQASYTYNQALELDKQYAQTKQLPQEIQSLGKSCVQ
jgi:hypothetical protein